MYFKNLNLILLLALVVAFTSCKKDNDSPVVCEPSFTHKYSEGVFVINEGPFGDYGSIDHINTTSKTIENSLFQTYNDNDVLGDVVQSMSYSNGKYYAIINNSNAIKVIDASTFKLITTIEGFELPRYMVIDGTKGYVSQWGSDGLSAKVVEVDLASNTILRQVDTGNGAERLMQYANKLIVPCSGGFGRDSVVQIIDITSFEIVNTIVVGDNPKGAVQANDNIWVSGRGHYDWGTGESTNGHLVELDPNSDFSIVNDVEIANGSSYPRSAKDGTVVYYSDGSGIHSVPSSDIASATLLIGGYFYGFDIDPKTGNIYVADAKDFSSLGEVKVFDTNSNELFSVETGIIPSHFYFID